MHQSPGKNVELERDRPVKRRLSEVALGLSIVLLAILASKFWIELKNSRRADSLALRQGVALTLEAAQNYDLDRMPNRETLETWTRFLQTTPAPKIPTRAAHEFLDSFVICYRDGILDSAEAGALYLQLAGFSPIFD